MNRIKIKRGNQGIISVTLDGKELWPTEAPNHFAVTSDMVKGIIVRELPHDLHFTVVNEITSDSIVLEMPLTYCVHNNHNNKAELHYLFQFSTQFMNDTQMYLQFAETVRAEVKKLASAEHLFEFSKCSESDGWISFSFKQILDYLKMDDVIRSARGLADKIVQIVDEIAHN